jgi:hypothetical protein
MAIMPIDGQNDGPRVIVTMDSGRRIATTGSRHAVVIRRLRRSARGRSANLRRGGLPSE